ncbi:MAG: DUF1566 domain-containing protein [Campylobacterota bacterium]|nr:DUF1566 domain-containing protein [Campylobacterota bacterium]
MKIIFLIIAIMSILNADFTKDGDVVTDNITKLQWQDDAIGSDMSWIAAINQCETLFLAGHSDWRLPNIKELTSLVDETKSNPSIDTTFVNTGFYDFSSGMTSTIYWTSTTSAGGISGAYRVNFFDATHKSSDSDDESLVRCVRGGE